MERSWRHPGSVEGHGDRVARCPQCASFTYDVTGLSEEEVRRLVLETEGRVLTRLVARRDGRVMSVDCGHGTLAKASSRWPVVLAVVLLGSMVSVGVKRALASRVGEPEAELVSQPPAQQELAPVVVPEPVVPPPVVESPPTVTPTATPVPRAAEVHLAEVHSSWATTVVVVSDVADALRAQLGPARECYQRRLEVAPDFRASIPLMLSLSDGLVEDVRISDGAAPRPGPSARVKGARTSTIVDNGTRHPEYVALRDCVQDAMRSVTFTQRERATLTFRLVFDGW